MIPIGSDRCCLRGNKNMRGRVFSGAWFHHFPGAFLDVVKYFTMIVPQESGQLSLSRLGNAMCEVGNSVQLSFHLLRPEKEPIFDTFWAEKLKNGWSSNQSRVLDVVVFWSHLQVFIGEVSAVDAGSVWRVKCWDGGSHWQIPGQFSVLFGDTMHAMYEDIQITLGEISCWFG